MGEFSPPLYLSPLLSFLFSYPLNIEIIFDFPGVITKIHPPFQNPGSALEWVSQFDVMKKKMLILSIGEHFNKLIHSCI